MASPTLGSVAGGMANEQLDLQSIQMNGLKIKDARIGLLRDTVSLNQQLTMLRLMQGLKPGEGGGTPDEMAGLMDQMSKIQFESGMPTEAANSAKVATQIRENTSKIDYRKYKLQSARLSQFANILDSVPDSPAGLKQALHLMLITDPSSAKDPKFQALSRMPWQPGLISQIKSQVLSAKDKAEISYREAAQKHADAATVADKARVGLIRAEEAYYNRRTTAIAKEGGSAPKANQLSAITDQATRDYPGADPADIRVRSRPLAEQMLKMMRDQHLTQSEAAARVYEKAKKSGVFNGLRPKPIRRGTAASNPLPLPDEPDKIIQNQWYTVQGEPMLAIGDKFYSEKEVKDMEGEDDALTDDGEDEAEDNE